MLVEIIGQHVVTGISKVPVLEQEVYLVASMELFYGGLMRPDSQLRG